MRDRLLGRRIDLSDSLNVGLVNLFQFNEGAGSRINGHLVNGYFGTLLGGPAWVGGKDGGALSFDAIDDYVDMPVISFSTGQSRTYSAWVKPTLSAGAYFITNYDPATGIFGFTTLINANGSVQFAWDGTTTPVTSAAGVLIANTWQHVAYVFAAGTNAAKAYVNGVQVVAGTLATEIPGTNRIRVSGRWVTANTGSAVLFPGAVSDLRIHRRALLPEEVKRLYAESTVGLVDPSIRFRRLSVASPIVLAASATVAVTATASLTTGIVLAASASIGVTGTASLTTGILLTGSALIAVTATASLTTGIVLSSTATIAVSSSAELTTSILLTGSALVSVTSTASLTTSINLTASALIDIAASSDLTTQPSGMYADAIIDITSAASLTTQINLTADAAIAITATGDLTTAIQLEATSTIVFTASAAMSTSSGTTGTPNRELFLQGDLFV